MHAHARRFLLLMVMMMAAAALVRCGRPAANRTKAPAVALGVIAHVPENDTPVRATVDVVFDRPMVALGATDPEPRAGAKLLHIEPAVSGAYHWIGTRTLSFVASGGLPPATQFRARIPAGVRALDGATLPQDITWEFTTPRPEIVASIPAAAGDSLARPGDPIVLLFNTAVEPEAVARAAQLEGVARWNASRPDSSLLRQLGAGFWGAELDRMVRLTVDPRLAADRDYELVLNDALRVRGGALGPREALRIRFRTHGAPGLRHLRGQGDILSLVLRTPVEPESARAYIRLHPAPERLIVWGYQRELYLGGALAPRTSYLVTLRAGMPDRFGQRLARDTTASVTTGGRAPQLQLAPQDAVLERVAPRQVAIVHAAVGPVRVSARRLGVSEEIALRARPVHGAGKAELERVLPAVSDSVARAGTELVDLGTVVAAGKPGAVLVEVHASVPGNAGRNSDWESRTVLRWTDLALAVKMAPENGTAWATQLASGAPRTGVVLRIQDDQGKILWRGQSDAQGLAQLPGYRALERDPWQLHLVGAVDGDTSYVALDGDWRVAPWRYDIPAEYEVPPVDARAFLYSDRNLYRPTETARIAGLVRRFSSRGLDASRLDSVRVVVTDPRGKAILSQRASVDGDGGFDFLVPLGAQPALGRYNANVQVPVPGKTPPENFTIGSLGFEVAAYRAPAFRVDVSGRTRHALAGEPLVADVTASYYFGAPLSGAALRWSCTRQRGHFHPAGFDDYVFEDPDVEDVEAGPVANDVGTLSDSGKAVVRVVVPPGSFPSTQLLTVEATVQDPSGDTVADWTGFYLHPAPVYAGVGLDRSFIVVGGVVTSRVVVVRADTAVAVSGASIEMELVRRTWRTASKLQVGGRVGYETTTVDSVLAERTVPSTSEPVSQIWTPSQPGMYLVRARARFEGHRTSLAVATFYVAGPSPGGWRPDDTPQVALQTDRATYAAGDTAQVLLASPLHTDRVLVTVEREGVLEARLVRIDPTSQTVAVPVLAEYAPNVYVGVAVVEPGLSESDAPNLPASARLPRYAVGYATLRLDVSSRRLAVNVYPDANEYAPGGTAALEVELHDAGGAAVAGRVGIAVVDEAVLALLGTPVPDPFAFFYSMRGLGVRNADTRLRLSAGASAEAKALKGEAGGDGGAGGEARSNFATTAYWNPNVPVDASGHAHVSVTLPDNLTRFRVVAVAASGQELFGAGQTHFRVVRSLVVQPALPRFAVLGDTLELAAVVTNRAEESHICRVEMTSALEAFDLRRGRTVRHPAAVPRVVTLEVAAGASRRVAFGAIAVERGTIPVRFTAHAGPASDAVAVNLPVVEPLLAWTEATAGATSTGTQEAVQMPPRAMPERTTLDLDLAASALAGAAPAFRNVQEYPFGCLEQNASRLLAFVLQKEAFAGEDAALTADLDAAIADAVRRVEAHATPWGAFTFWPGGGPAPGWAATWATFALARASKAGAPVSEDLQSSAPWRLAAQWREARGEASKPPAPFGLGFWAFSELARPEAGGAFEPADVDVAVDASLQWPEDERFWLALALARWELRPDFVRATREAALDKLENTAAGSLVPAIENDALPQPFCTSARATSLALALAATSLPPEDARTTRLATGLLGLRREAHWGHTQDDVLALFALATYRARIEKTAGPLAAAIHNGTEELLRLDAAAGSLARASRTVAWPAAAGAFDISATGGGTAHYAAVLRGFEDGRTASADESGFTLVRRIERLEGKGPLRLGDLAVVTLEIVVPRESHYLAVRDPLPGGLEVVQTQFRVEGRVARDALAHWSGAQRLFPATHTEKRDREVWVFADDVPAGVYVQRYVVRVRAAGGFAHMPATIEAMYTPELVGRTPPSRFRALPPVAEKP